MSGLIEWGAGIMAAVEPWAAWLVVAGPALLIGGALKPAHRANAAPRAIASWSQGAALVSLALALGALIWVGWAGVKVGPMLGHAGIGFSVYLDAVSTIMFVLVSFIGAVVLRYSATYLDGDPNHGRFIQWMSVTLASVLLLIISGNLAQFILAWIATSIGLNHLLLFYSERQGAQLAARKKFIASRIGDICLIAAAFLLFSQFGSLEFATLFPAAKALSDAGTGSGLIAGAGVLMAVSALLKSAQLPLHGWLIEVMETPTPVSALLHAGIINAGGYLILRMAVVMNHSIAGLELLVIVGGITALFGSSVLLTQNSIKAALAYSTVAQMGFMLLQCGLGAYPAALLHIVAHSLYKAHAFLSSGSVIDMARMSWSPSPGGRPHAVRLGLALALVATIVLIGIGVAGQLGINPNIRPGTLALGAILLMGLVHLVAQGIDERPNSYVLVRTGLSAFAVAATWFGLQWGAETLVGTALPGAHDLRGLFDWAVVAIVVIGFGSVTLFQSVMAERAKSRFWQAAYVHLSHGLYLNTIANRIVLRVWPSQLPQSSPAR
jgi:NAD(P)H-quinone oxidoreductase subunit 5